MSALLLPLSSTALATTEDDSMSLAVTPEQAVVTTGVQHRLTAQITSAGGCIDDVECNIDFEVESGPGDLGNTREQPDYDCQIGAGLQSCFVDVTSPEAGTNVIRVWIDDDGTSEPDADLLEGRRASITPGTRPDPDDTDVVEVRWATPGVVTRVDAFTEGATTSTTKSHSVTCKLVDGFGTGVAGRTCDADIPRGPNKNNDVDNDPITRNGYLGECMTVANGTCTFTYKSSETGTDRVLLFYDENLDNFKAGEPQDAVSRTWTSDITTGPCAGLNYGQTAPLAGGGKRFAGTPNDDNRTGTPFRDVFCGFAGVDRFDAGGGDDLAVGGSGNDTLLGRKGNDRLQGSDGNDNLQGAEGRDKIFSGKGNDKTSGGFGNDKVYGEAGIDLVQGFAGDDTLGGGDGADKIKGGSGRDNLAGGSGPDALNGGSGNDRCNGGPGADTLTSC